MRLIRSILRDLREFWPLGVAILVLVLVWSLIAAHAPIQGWQPPHYPDTRLYCTRVE